LDTSVELHTLAVHRRDTKAQFHLLPKSSQMRGAIEEDAERLCKMSPMHSY